MFACIARRITMTVLLLVAAGSAQAVFTYYDPNWEGPNPPWWIIQDVLEYTVPAEGGQLLFHTGAASYDEQTGWTPQWYGESQSGFITILAPLPCFGNQLGVLESDVVIEIAPNLCGARDGFLFLGASTYPSIYVDNRRIRIHQEAAARPFNDEPQTPSLLITGSDRVESIGNASYSSSVPAPSCCTFVEEEGWVDVWFSYKPSQKGVYSVALKNRDEDRFSWVFAVYQNNEEIACAYATTSCLTFLSEAEQETLIRVFQPACDPVPYEFEITLDAGWCEPLANDEPDDDEYFEVGKKIYATNRGASGEHYSMGCDPCLGGAFWARNDVWFTFEADELGEYSVEVPWASPGFNPAIIVYDENKYYDTGDLYQAMIACNDDRETGSLLPKVCFDAQVSDLLVQVAGVGETQAEREGDFELLASRGMCDILPPNDERVDCIFVRVGDQICGHNYFANGTFESICGFTGEGDVWYRLFVEETAPVEIILSHHGITQSAMQIPDPVIAVYRANSSLEELCMPLPVNAKLDASGMKLCLDADLDDAYDIRVASRLGSAAGYFDLEFNQVDRCYDDPVEEGEGESVDEGESGTVTEGEVISEGEQVAEGEVAPEGETPPSQLLTAQQIIAYLQDLQRYRSTDSDQNGRIAYDELSRAVDAEKLSQSAFDEVDVNDDALINQTEANQLPQLAKTDADSLRAFMGNYFSLLDYNQDGGISYEELSTAILLAPDAGDKLEESHRSWDRDRDGVVTQDELKVSRWSRQFNDFWQDGTIRCTKDEDEKRRDGKSADIPLLGALLGVLLLLGRQKRPVA